jgi:hypothetical protein
VGSTPAIAGQALGGAALARRKVQAQMLSIRKAVSG